MLTLIKRQFAIASKGSTLKGASRKWMDRHINDPYVKQAKIQSYRSRAAFKLIEINDKFTLFKPGMKVIDVGAAPGGWSQIIAEKVESKYGAETVVAVDLLDMEPIDGVKFIQGDIEKEDVQEKLSELLDFQRADMVCSDAVPEFVGERFVDHVRSTQLNYLITKFCQKNLKVGGSLLMKIIQGPAEQTLYDDTKLLFDKIQRVKPSASRQESKEIYLLGQGYDQSKEEQAIALRKERKRMESVRTPEEADEIIKEAVDQGKQVIQELLNMVLQSGHDLPDELKDRMKTSQIGKDLNIQQKMSLREKQKAKRKTEDQEEKSFFEQTGIKDKSKDFTMENLIKKYEHDMERHERKLAKMKQLEKTGQSYDLDDIVLTDDEKEGDFFERKAEERLKEKRDYEDEPYKAVDEEKMNLEKQFENISQQIESLKGKVEDGEKLTKESEYFKEYEKIIDQMEEFHDMGFRMDHKSEQEQLRSDEAKEYDRLYQQEKTVRDSLFARQEQRARLRKTGGAKTDSPVWKDDE